VCGDAVQGGRSAWCPGGSAPAVRARASHGRGAGVSSIGSCASSVCTPFVAIGVGIGSGASASAGARTQGPPVPSLRGRALSWSCAPRRWRPVWLVLGRSGATRRGRLQGASCASVNPQSPASAWPPAGVQSCPGVSLPLQNPFKFLMHLCAQCGQVFLARGALEPFVAHLRKGFKCDFIGLFHISSRIAGCRVGSRSPLSMNILYN
jgi:hypothetical protein